MAWTFGGEETLSGSCKFFSCGEVGEGDVELGVFHVHVHSDKPFFFGQLQAGVYGIVEQVAEDNAQIQVRDGKLHRDEGSGADRDAFGLCKGYFAV